MAYGLDNMALRDDEGETSRSARQRPAIPDRRQVRAAPASASPSGYAEVYEHRQRGCPARMRGDGTASASARTRPQQVRTDVHEANIPKVDAEEDSIYDVGITDYSSNGHNQVPEYEQGYQSLQTIDEEVYEVPVSVPSKYMNKDTAMNEENVYLEIDEVEMMIQRDNDGDDDDDHDDTEL